MMKTLLFFSILSAATPAFAQDKIKAEFEALKSSFDGKMGICAIKDLKDPPICVNGSERFPLQSVMKLIVATAVLDAVDAKKIRLDDKLTLTPEDGSPGPREFYDRIVDQGKLTTTVEDLLRRSLNDSDSTSADFLIQKLGGIEAIQKFLREKKIEGIRIDRDEKTLQSEFHGLSWQAKFAKPELFQKAVEAVPKADRLKAAEAYLADPRDTATPEGMIDFLKRLFTTKILSLKSTEKLLLILEKARTGQNRLKAGIPKNWTLGHKTGTSSSLEGRTFTTNDVGVITSPEGQLLPIAVFLSDSKQSDQERGKVMAQAARVLIRTK